MKKRKGWINHKRLYHLMHRYKELRGFSTMGLRLSIMRKIDAMGCKARVSLRYL